MPRTYIRKKPIQDPAKFEAAIKAVNEGMNVKKAAALYEVSWSTLYKNRAKVVIRKPGFPKAFSDGEEASLVSHLRAVSDLGMPLNSFELRLVAKAYLDRIGKTVPRFKSNLPGKFTDVNILVNMS